MDCIHDAIDACDVARVEQLLHENPASIHVYNSRGETPLHRAVWGGHERIVSLLIDADADVNASGLNDGNTPLHYAAHSGRPAAVAEMLVDQGARIEETNRLRETPLFVAAMRNRSVAQVLLTHGAFFDMNSAVLLGDTSRVRQLLKEDPEFRRVPFPAVLLDSALQRGKPELVRLLLDHGVDPNRGAPPLFTAAARVLNDPDGDTEVLQMLLERGADVAKRSAGASIFDFVDRFPSARKERVLDMLRAFAGKK